MDLNNVTLEITSLIITFDHYEALVANLLHNKDNSGFTEEFEKISGKNAAQLDALFGVAEFYDEEKQLKKLFEIKETIKSGLQGIDTKKIHEVIERLEKNAKRMRKLYKVLQQ